MAKRKWKGHTWHGWVFKSDIGGLCRTALPWKPKGKRVDGKWVRVRFVEVKDGKK